MADLQNSQIAKENESTPNPWVVGGILAAILLMGGWAYRPTLAALVGVWRDKPDCWYVWLIFPLSISFLWCRSDLFPRERLQRKAMGVFVTGMSVFLFLGAVVTRTIGLDACSLVVWSAGVTWCLGGFPLSRWAWPSVVVLLFMVPIPFPFEQILAGPLQKASAEVACYLLQLGGNLAINDGFAVVVQGVEVDIRQYQDGITALHSALLSSFAWTILGRRTLQEGLYLMACAVPISLLVAATRIAAGMIARQPDIGIALQQVLVTYARWAHIPSALLLFWIASGYFFATTYRIEILEIDDLLPSSDRMAELPSN